MLTLSISTIVLLFTFLYFMQERLLFHPTKLPKTYNYQFSDTFEEVNLEVAKNIFLNALLFKTQQQKRKGMVLFLHGNGGAIDGWGMGAGFLKFRDIRPIDPICATPIIEVFQRL